MSGNPRTAAGRALLDEFEPGAVIAGGSVEEYILAIEAEAATPGESRTLVKAVEDVLVELDIIRDHWNRTSKAMLVHRDTVDALRAALAVIPDDPATPPESR